MVLLLVDVAAHRLVGLQQIHGRRDSAAVAIVRGLPRVVLVLQLFDLLPEILSPQCQVLALDVKPGNLPIHLHGADHGHEPRDLCLAQGLARERRPQQIRPLRRIAVEHPREEVVQGRRRRRRVVGARWLRVRLPERRVRGDGLNRDLQRSALQQHLLEAQLALAALRGCRGRATVLRGHLLDPAAVELGDRGRRARGTGLVLQPLLDLDAARIPVPDVLADPLDRCDHLRRLLSERAQCLPRASVPDGLPGLAHLADSGLQPRHRAPATAARRRWRACARRARG
mmetsp:Transcript_172675/g.553423  ORF Transcript_172675/g.553423 Transcript_172675/m.553423 type:complete len:285 (+) Transcript_172675:1009-1863(+)